MLNSPIPFNVASLNPLSGGALGDVDQHKVISDSRQRSQDYGLRPEYDADFSVAPRNEMTLLRDKHRFLYQHALPIMENLYEQIANTQSVILLTSANGTILHSVGDTEFLEKTAQVALIPGVEWSERSKGTNAIGTALALEKPVVVHGAQHFLRANEFLTCSCTPIFDPNGILLGALDVSGDYRSYHHHTMALARMSAQMIENRMFANVFSTEIQLHFHSRPEFLGTLVEGIAVFSQDGRFISANRSAQYQLGMLIPELKTHTLLSLTGITISKLANSMQRAQGAPISLELHNGVRVYCRCEMHVPASFAGTSFSDISTSRPEPVASKKGPLSSLKYLDTGDPQLATVIQKLRIVQGRDIPIMVLGETGAGKDLLAQAIHNDSDRSLGKFVSVNCASIPESLIESELFGYEEGAFTGARKKGAIGYIQAAHGGTLFLDEIGDMPMHLQARLLRVLQDRKVTPLGGGKEISVDVAVICATNKNLKQMIASGEFREDLYYRLNGLVVRLPALRERQDFDCVTQKILDSLAGRESTLQISSAVMQLLKAYRWPGNFRQLHNLLRTAVAMAVAQDSVTIEIIHLPDDFLDEIGSLEELMPACGMFSAAASVATEAALPLNVAQIRSLPPAPADPLVLNLSDVAIEAMAQALRNARGNVSLAAKTLGVSRNTIYRKKHLLPDDVWQ